MPTLIETLKEAIEEFAGRHPDSIRTYDKGHRVIIEGDEGTDFFMVRQGSLSILVRNPVDGSQREIALRFDGDLMI
jgi:CRP-like cAMP-binding protein